MVIKTLFINKAKVLQQLQIKTSSQLTSILNIRGVLIAEKVLSLAESKTWTRNGSESFVFLEISRNKIYEEINISCPKIILLNKRTSLLIFLKKWGI